MGGEIASVENYGVWGHGSGYKDGIYCSKRPTEHIPSEPYLDFATYSLGSNKYLDRVALVDAPTGESLTYRQLKQRVKSVASGLAEVGVKQGDTVMVLSPNSIHLPVLLFAATSVGAVVTALNPLSTTVEIVRQAEDSKTTYLAAVPGLGSAAAILSIPLILIDDGIEENGASPKPEHSGVTPVACFSELLKADPSKAPKVDIRQTDTALLLYSSGTTGMNKGVILSHGNIIAASCLSHDISYKEDVQRTNIVTIPLFHIYVGGHDFEIGHVSLDDDAGMVLLCCSELWRGSKLVILPRFDFPKFLSAIERYKVTHARVVPPIFAAMTRSPLVEKYDLSSLEFIGVGAAPVAKDLLISCSRRYKGVFLRQGYALTESGACGTSTPPDSAGPRYGSVGTLIPNMEAKIVDLESGKPLPPNQSGEIWLRGPANMQGYLNNDKATAETLDSEGWLHTGDVGYFAEDGYLFIVDRLKDLIKYNGFQVAPAELEAILNSHHQIADAAVAGFPDEMSGQIPVAFIVREKNSSLSGPDVKQFVAKQVAPHKKVRKVVFVDIIPRSASGKILRRELRLRLTSSPSRL